MPIVELAAICREFDVPMHSDAVQAVAPSARRFRGERAVGAEHRRRTSSAARTASVRCCWDARCPVCRSLHGGGHERDVRSGTPDYRVRRGHGCGAAGGHRRQIRCPVHRRIAGAARSSVRRCRRRCIPDVDPQRTRRGAGRLPGNAHMTFPGCEGDSLLMLLDAAGYRMFDRFGVHGRCGAGQPRADRDGCDHRDCPRAPCDSRWAHHDPSDIEVDSVDRRAQVVERARAAGMASAVARR